MKEKIKLLTAIREKDSEKLKSYLTKLIDTLVLIQTGFANARVDDWKDQKLEYLLTKITLHEKTFLKSIEPVLINPTNPHSGLVDISSVFIIVRACIENFLTIFYLYILPENDDEYEFFHLLFSSASMIRRQDIKRNYDDENEKPTEQKLKDGEMIQDLVKKLQKMKTFESLNRRKRKNIESMNPTSMKAMLYNWNELIIKSDLRNELFKNTWRLASSYAHSEELSLIQLKDFYGNKKGKFGQKNFITSMINLNCMLVSLTIIFIKNKYNWAEQKYNNLDFQLKEEIEIWKILATKSE